MLLIFLHNLSELLQSDLRFYSHKFYYISKPRDLSRVNSSGKGGMGNEFKELFLFIFYTFVIFFYTNNI